MLPLQGLRVVAVEVYGAGPYGTAHLADLGAEVIKIENGNTGGDVSRAVGPYFLGENDSQFYQSINRNKKSLSLDLKTEKGQAVFHRLSETADGLVGNLRGNQPEKLGLTYAHASFEEASQSDEGLGQVPARQRRGLVEGADLPLDQGQVMQRVEDQVLAVI